MATISAIVFIFWPDERDYLTACLESVKWTDEIIVIDNGANEETVAVAKKYSKKIYKTEDKSFAGRHNLASQKATGDWLLFIDADERISMSLREEIKKTISEETPLAAFELRRVNYYLAKPFRYGDRYPDFVTRLFKKDRLQNWTGTIHESSQVAGNIARLNSPFYHFTHRNIETMVQKTLVFSDAEAHLRLAVNHPPVVWWRLIRVFLTEFVRRLFRLQGYREGTEGWIDGILQAFSLFIIYARLWELQRKVSLEASYKKLDNQVLAGEI